MDIPAANCVIRFDPVQHAVSYVQAGLPPHKFTSIFKQLGQGGRRMLVSVGP